jgi:phosphotransferase system  glucose/maltose/N-acetylglucosamine-specific IIC component
MEGQHTHNQRGSSIIELELFGFVLVGLFLPMAVHVLLACTVITLRSVLGQRLDFVFLPLFAYSMYAVIGVVALVVLFKSRSRHLKYAAVSTLLGGLLMTGGYSLLIWTSQAIAESR